MKTGTLGPLVVALGLGAWALFQLPICDDEANAISLALSGPGPVLAAGLGKGGHFHPPLSDLLLSLWLAKVAVSPLWHARLPAFCFWLLTLRLSQWALLPLASETERRYASWALALFPVHWVLPFIATWYSLAAFLGMLSTGALLHALSPAQTGPRRILFFGLWCLGLVALGYTVFAWPATLIGQAALLWRGLGLSAFRPHLTDLSLGLLLVVLGLSPTLWVMLDRMGFAVHGAAGGGGLNPVGAVLALLLGETAPALPWLIVASGLCVLLAWAYLWRTASRAAQGFLLAGFSLLLTLALTRTLADKRLLLGSGFIAVGFGMALTTVPPRLPTVLLLLGALPAAFGFISPKTQPLLFPRWQDPHAELSALHCALAEPGLAVVNHPALELTLRSSCGVLSAEHSDKAERIIAASRQERMLTKIENGKVRATSEHPLTVDLVSFVDAGEIWRARLMGSLKAQGFVVAEQRNYGNDRLAQFRGQERSDGVRFRWTRLTFRPLPLQ